MAEYAIIIVAKNGFFCKDEINLRLVCSELSEIHKHILFHLKLKT